MSDFASIHPSLPDVLREMANDGSVRTHSESCWQWHLPCAAMYAADRLEAAEGLLRWYVESDLVDGGDEFGAWDDDVRYAVRLIGEDGNVQ